MCVILGLALLISPGFFTRAISYTIGGISLGIGVLSALRFFLAGDEKGEYTSTLFRGIVLCAMGIFLIVKPDFIFKIIAIAFGLYMLFSGIVSLSDALAIRKGSGKWQMPCVMAAITILLGIVILCDPLFTVDSAVRIMGAALLISGVTNLSGCFVGGRQLKALSKELERAEKNGGDYIDI